MGRSAVLALVAASTMILALAGSGTSWASTRYKLGGTANDIHRLNLFIGGPQCDPDQGDSLCQYAVRGQYDDTAGPLGHGTVNGRFKFETTSFDGTIGDAGCFHVRSGVLKFTNGPNRIRFRMSKPTAQKPGTSTICQTWDGTTPGVNGPDRTIHWVLTETTGACAGDWCAMFTSGHATWDSRAIFDPTAQVPTYDDQATFKGSLRGP